MEALGVVWAAKHFRAYLYGHQCTVFTDHAPLRALFKSAHPSGKLARWAHVLSELDLDIRYKPGRKNANADALSRAPVGERSDEVAEVQVAMIDQCQDADLGPADRDSRESSELDHIQAMQESDSELSEIMELVGKRSSLPEGQAKKKKVANEFMHFEVIEGVLWYVDSARGSRPRLVVPKAVQEKVMAEMHSGPFGGHFAARGTYEKLARRYYWRGMYADVYRHCQGCLTCAAYRGGGRRTRAPLLPIKVGLPFEKVGVDILEMPVTDCGNRYIVVFMDYLTKWVEAFPLPDQTSESIARLLVDHVICRHGVPKELLSDRGSNLLSGLMQDVCRLTGMKKVNSTASHPQTDGLVENMNKTLRAMLAKHGRQFGPNWDLHLQQLLFAYRSKPHESTCESPFFLLYGRDARLPTESTLEALPSLYREDTETYGEELAEGLARAWQNARDAIEKAQKHQKRQYDKRSDSRPYQKGGRVMVYMPVEDTWKRRRKMALPYHGPYRILEVRPNTLLLRPVDRHDAEPILVNVDRAVRCSPELPDESWLGPRTKRKRTKRRKTGTRQPAVEGTTLHQTRYPLRSRYSRGRESASEGGNVLSEL